jgi:hypothetical protein
MVVRFGVEAYPKKLGTKLRKSKNNSVLMASNLRTILSTSFSSWNIVCPPLNVET